MVGAGLTADEHKETFGEDGRVPKLACGDDHTTISFLKITGLYICNGWS